jgi:hypothetical protein
MGNRVVLIAMFVLIVAIWFSAFTNACASGASAGFFGPSIGPPIFIGGGGWNRGGWDRGGFGGSTTPSFPSRSSGGSIGGGGIRGGFGGK